MTQTNNTAEKAQSPPLPQNLRVLLNQPLDVKLHLLQHHMELARLLVQEILEEDVVEHAGDRYSHDKPLQGRYSRLGSNPGSVRIGQQKIPIEVPRLKALPKLRKALQASIRRKQEVLNEEPLNAKLRRYLSLRLIN